MLMRWSTASCKPWCLGGAGSILLVSFKRLHRGMVAGCVGCCSSVCSYFWVLRLGLVWVTGFRCAGLARAGADA